MTPEEFADRMREIARPGDPEASHAAANDLMIEVLKSLGYEEGTTLFEGMGKWYA